MTYRELVGRLLEAKVLHPGLVALPNKPATDLAIATAGRRIGAIDHGLVQFYAEWDGANLDVVRVLSPDKLRKDTLGVIFGSDPAGFIYRFDQSGQVSREDTDGGEVKIVASNFRDFIFGYVFGPRAAEFAGQEWHDEVRNLGVAT